MKKLFFLAAAVLLSGTMQARNWRINSIPEAKADFSSITDATASADVKDGDVLYLDPGCHLTGEQRVTKGVTIIGTGFNLGGSEMESSVQSINIQCSDVVLTGVHIQNYLNANSPDYKNVEVVRCKIGSVSASAPMLVASCYITSRVSLGSNARLYNNIILGPVGMGEGGIMRNNAIVCSQNTTFVGTTRCTIVDNIIINTYNYRPEDVNNTLYNTDPSYGNDIKGNILSNDADHVYADHPSNAYVGATVADVFVNEGMYDELYRLKEDSPAKGAGYGGNDCGPFAGYYPYVMSCRPKNIPYIYDAIVPNHPTDNKITVTVKAKNQNE